jgi:hypothetical protein
MPAEALERKLRAILAIAGYSRLLGLDEEGTLARLKGLRQEVINLGSCRHFDEPAFHLGGHPRACWPASYGDRRCGRGCSLR